MNSRDLCIYNWNYLGFIGIYRNIYCNVLTLSDGQFMESNTNNSGNMNDDTGVQGSAGHVA